MASVFAAIESAGLAARGALLLADDERVGVVSDARTIVLVGVAGRFGWDAFAASPEARDGEKNPLDRFSRRVIDGLSRAFGAVALYPFGGPPFFPFQQWARRAEPVHPSPIGLLVHPRYGLWHSYRGALAFPEALDIPTPARSANPCDACAEKPCLAACPVAAFTASGYDVPACVAHLRGPKGIECMSAGCLARRACPVGADHAHGLEQAAFAMRAFLRAHEAPEG